MGNRFGTDILIQTKNPKKAAEFYVRELGFEVNDESPNLISLLGDHINLFIELGPRLGPVLEVTVENVEESKARLLKSGCEIIKDEPDFPRCYVKDPFGLVYNLAGRRLVSKRAERLASKPVAGKLQPGRTLMPQDFGRL